MRERGTCERNEEAQVKTSKPSQDYHDYVFRDGRLVGDFEGMYLHSREIPWHQDVNSFDTISDIDIAILKRHVFDNICDFGCGLGYFTSRLKRELKGRNGNPPEHVCGMDISVTAVSEAARLHPDCEFQALDLLADSWISPSRRYDLVVCRGVLWYVVQDLKTALNRIASLGNAGSHALVTLSFPPSKTWVGQESIGSAEDLKTHLSMIMDITYWCVEYDAKHGNVPLCHAYGALRQGEGGDE